MITYSWRECGWVLSLLEVVYTDQSRDILRTWDELQAYLVFLKGSSRNV